MEWIILALIVTIVSILIFWAIYEYDKKKHENFVKSHSLTLKNLQALNNRFLFEQSDNLAMFYTYDNEKLFDQINCEDYLIYQLQFLQGKVFQEISKINKNKSSFTQYKTEVAKITQLGKYEVPPEKLRTKKLIQIETRLYEKSLQTPTTTLNITVTLLLTSLNGRPYGSKHDTFTQSQITALIKRVNNKNGYYFNDKAIWNAICKVERGKVSNKMRFLIYQRDGNRCCNCGISDRFANLEIDHIIPISKGGKSTLDNLQTLCHECNVAKGASIPYHNRNNFF
jgi:hypothetical protein